MFRQVQNIVNAADFPGQIVIDLSLPANIGGYYLAADDTTEVIGLHPLAVLFGTKESLIHILKHELTHAGVGLNAQDANVMDESLTDLITQQFMAEQNIPDKFRSGYQELVRLISQHLGHLSAAELLAVVEADPLQTLANLLAAMFVQPICQAATPGMLTEDSIRFQLRRHWRLVQLLFPRLLNEIAAPYKGLHDQTEADLSPVIWQTVAGRIAEQILAHGRLTEVVDYALASIPTEMLDEQHVFTQLALLGYGYLCLQQMRLLVIEVVGNIARKRFALIPVEI
jgi:hypothetical protein